MNTILHKFRKKINNGHVNGIFCKTSDPAFIEAAGYSGLDFAILDMEHGPNDYKTVENLVRASEISSILSIVRVSHNEPWLISKALDTGALGVQIPNISSLEEAKQAIMNAKFYPSGNRGVWRVVRASDYANIPKKQYFSQSNETIICLQVEGGSGLKDIDEILKLEGFDILFIGPYDLSQSLGIPGDIYNERIMDLYSDIVKKANFHGKQVGTFYDEIERKKWFIDAGINYLSFSVDTDIFRRACINIVK